MPCGTVIEDNGLAWAHAHALVHFIPSLNINYALAYIRDGLVDQDTLAKAKLCIRLLKEPTEEDGPNLEHDESAEQASGANIEPEEEDQYEVPSNGGEGDQEEWGFDIEEDDFF